MDNEKFLKAKKICNEGVAYMNRNAYTKALSYFNQVEPIIEKENSLAWLSYLYHQKFICYLRLEKIVESQELAEKVIDNYKKEKNKKGLLGFLLNYSELWEKKKDLAKALQYAKISQSMAKIYKAPSYYSYIYLRLGLIYKEYRFYVRSLSYYKKALELFVEEDNKLQQAKCWNEKGVIYQEIFLMDESLAAFEQAAKIFLAEKDIDSSIQNLERARKIYLELGSTEKARDLEKKMINIGKQKL